VGDEAAARLAGHAGSGKLASVDLPRHKRRMRCLILAALLIVAACAPRPAATPTPEPASTATPAPSQDGHRAINGMTAGEVMQLFGKPRLQVVEGNGTKLQFAGPSCVLDIYLYPPSSGPASPRVTHIEARNFQGGEVSAQSCAASVQDR
jgi:hypothetical protein